MVPFELRGVPRRPKAGGRRATSGVVEAEAARCGAALRVPRNANGCGVDCQESSRQALGSLWLGGGICTRRKRERPQRRMEAKEKSHGRQYPSGATDGSIAPSNVPYLPQAPPSPTGGAPLRVNLKQQHSVIVDKPAPNRDMHCVPFLSPSCSSFSLPLPLPPMAPFVTANGNKCPMCGNQLGVKVAKGGEFPGSSFIRAHEKECVRRQQLASASNLPALPDSASVTHLLGGDFATSEEWLSTSLRPMQAFDRWQEREQDHGNAAAVIRHLDNLYGVKSPTPETETPTLQQAGPSRLRLPSPIQQTGRLRSLSASPELPAALFPTLGSFSSSYSFSPPQPFPTPALG
ncbi:hypothetical protein B0H14DRAFT_2587345 [Mycena olivaceomarginata]|nr:hypothetical protein B0H14DRAFT_2587345 [Mycena olivaceomarginata]